LYALWKWNAQQQVRVTLGNLLRQDDVSASQFRSTSGSTTRTTTVPGYASIRALYEHKF
jgi:hypothetical protein